MIIQTLVFVYGGVLVAVGFAIATSSVALGRTWSLIEICGDQNCSMDEVLLSQNFRLSI